LQDQLIAESEHCCMAGAPSSWLPETSVLSCFAVPQVKKLDGQVASLQAKVRKQQEESTAASAASTEALTKLRSHAKRLEDELTRQRLINRQMKSEHLEQVTNLAAQQHQQSQPTDTAALQHLLGAMSTSLVSIALFRCATRVHGFDQAQCAACNVAALRPIQTSSELASELSMQASWKWLQAGLDFSCGRRRVLALHWAGLPICWNAVPWC
jgi:hypothetical protein